MGAIELQIVDLNLFSGSSDTMRSAIGGFWTTYSSSEGSTLVFEGLEHDSGMAYIPSIGYFSKISSRANDADYIEVVDSSTILPNKRFPVRIYGDSEYIKDDLFWKTIFVGGTFGEYSYPALYNENLFERNYTTLDLPYPRLSSSLLSTQILDEIQITCEYNSYLPQYQNYADNLNSELLIPNFYVLSDMSTYSFETANDLYNEKLLQWVTLGDTYSDIEYLFDVNTEVTPAETDFTVEELRRQTTVSQYYHLNTSYLTAAFVQRPVSSSTATWVESKFKNVLLDADAIDKLYNVDLATSNDRAFPYYNKISFPPGGLGDFGQSIIDNNFSSRFLKTLYETFSDNIDSLIPATSSFALNTAYLSGTADPSVYYERNETNNSTLRSVEYVPFLTYCRDHYSSSAPNCIFIGENTLARDSITKGGGGAYRYFNTLSSVGVLNDAIMYLSSSSNFDVDSLGDVYDNTPNHVETLAYRIEKIGGLPEGDGQTQSALQNYWIMNSDLEVFDFIDTQVKYDTRYTYTVYAYLLVVGLQYKFSELGLTRQLGCEDDSGRYGLEFYNPYSAEEESVNKKFTSGEYFESVNSLGNDAQTFNSTSPYLADFYLEYAPSLKIIEMPLFTKSFKLTDNLPNLTSVEPYQLLDASQTIGFDLSYLGFVERVYPSAITSEDMAFKENYLYARDLWEWDILGLESISQVRYMEVYRLSEKPTATTDFDGGLISTLDLIMDNSNYTYTTDFFENRIRANQKYYYLFRALNEQGVAGDLSVIYEAELVNDGGYLYSVFNVIHEEELGEEVFVNPSKSFKKLIQVRPNYSQIELDTTHIDYNQEAASQMENLGVGTAADQIWNRTFKIRLTSKKTSKKIDLNITYDLMSEY